MGEARDRDGGGERGGSFGSGGVVECCTLSASFFHVPAVVCVSALFVEGGGLGSKSLLLQWEEAPGEPREGVDLWHEGGGRREEEEAIRKAKG